MVTYFIKINIRLCMYFILVSLFVGVNVLHPSQERFSHIRIYFLVDLYSTSIKCLVQEASHYWWNSELLPTPTTTELWCSSRWDNRTLKQGDHIC